ncbi:MAG: hypothetical protein DRI95_08305 [Bacteroidetes bacterium]|nr:MAG: hypothetical protein DRI95_08305 [Bacteroidota bacterium]
METYLIELIFLVEVKIIEIFTETLQVFLASLGHAPPYHILAEEERLELSHQFYSMNTLAGCASTNYGLTLPYILILFKIIERGNILSQLLILWK